MWILREAATGIDKDTVIQMKDGLIIDISTVQQDDHLHSVSVPKVFESNHKHK